MGVVSTPSCMHSMMSSCYLTMAKEDVTVFSRSVNWVNQCREPEGEANWGVGASLGLMERRAWCMCVCVNIHVRFYMVFQCQCDSARLHLLTRLCQWLSIFSPHPFSSVFLPVQSAIKLSVVHSAHCVTAYIPVKDYTPHASQSFVGFSPPHILTKLIAAH